MVEQHEVEQKKQAEEIEQLRRTLMMLQKRTAAWSESTEGTAAGVYR